MKQLLLLPILCLMPAAANAESVWLLLSRDASFEKIEMRDMQQCREMRHYFWENGGRKSGSYTMCLRGK